jgi:hypothetical protein
MYVLYLSLIMLYETCYLMERSKPQRQTHTKIVMQPATQKSARAVSLVGYLADRKLQVSPFPCGDVEEWYIVSYQIMVGTYFVHLGAKVGF